ncbi:MAG TPA: hypothetical protein VFR86_24390 [Burkholderiaceae bacterium]|nr:hypothetical protein [Burkholderiaceae bacterium]
MADPRGAKRGVARIDVQDRGMRRPRIPASLIVGALLVIAELAAFRHFSAADPVAAVPARAALVRDADRGGGVRTP